MTNTMMQPKRTMTMNWDGLGDDDDDFFDSNNRISAVVPVDFDDFSSGSDDEFEDPRMSFAEAARLSSVEAPPRISSAGGPLENYDLWIAAPTSINERRRKLLNGMGLNSSKELLRIRTFAMSKRHGNVSMKPKRAPGAAPPLPPSGLPKSTASTAPSSSKNKKDDTEKNNEGHHQKRDEDGHNNTSNNNDDNTTTNNNDDTTTTNNDNNIDNNPESQLDGEDGDIDPLLLVRSRSDGDIQYFSVDMKRRKEELLGTTSKQRLTRTLSSSAAYARVCKLKYTIGGDGHTKDRVRKKRRSSNSETSMSQNNQTSSGQLTAFFLIKNLDTGKEFIVKEFAEDGMWNRLSDLQTGKQLTMEEFEKSVGHSRLVKELMRREKGRGHGQERKNSVNALLSKSFKYSKKKSQSLIKTMSKKVSHSASGTSGLHVDENHQTTTSTSNDQLPLKGVTKTNTSPSPGPNPSTNNNPEWVKVRTQGKNIKELTALRFCQEIQAHEGSIWTLKFNFDGRYLASAGEDKLIHVWEVQECEIGTEEGSTPMFCPSPDRALLEKKGKSTSRKGGMIPDHVQLPENVFALSNEPICSLEGHLDDVLDLSWSSSQSLLLSSSMDKTVRLWDLEKKACLKLFSHNDYVTCIQFNPMNDDYFISGSLDAKVRLWNVSGRRVVDWTDLNEMVTATCYTSDGQGVAIGSHKGNCRMYSITDGKLNQTSQFDIPTKKKTTPKKITGFEFNAEKPSEVLVTSADSRVRIYDGIDVVQKFRGFRNMNSQIAASFSPDGKYVISASEDSNIYLWKKQEHKNAKTKTTIDTSAHESFQCKDVSVAIPWPGATGSTHSHNKNGTKDDKNKKHLPPLPNGKKPTDSTDNENNNEEAEESSTSHNSTLSASPSKSAARPGGGNTADTACGLVVVTAGLGGEIRAYQNFGLPLKVGTNLF